MLQAKLDGNSFYPLMVFPTSLAPPKDQDWSLNTPSHDSSAGVGAAAAQEEAADGRAGAHVLRARHWAGHVQLWGGTAGPLETFLIVMPN